MRLSPRNLSVVLVEPSHPGNVGAVARAMSNLGVNDLRLVNPCDVDHPAAPQMATKATSILKHARRFENLAAAVHDRQRIIGTTARIRARNAEITRLWDIQELLPAQSCTMALVFGRESSGLTNAEVAVCNAWIHIPTFGPSRSLNLAQAVIVTLYELSKHYPASLRSASRPSALAPSRDVEGLKRHLWTVLRQVDFLKPNQEATLRHSFADLVARAKLTDLDVRLIRGFFHRIEVTIRRG